MYGYEIRFDNLDHQWYGADLMQPWSQPLLWQGAAGGGAITTWNPADKDAGIVLSGGNLIAAGDGVTGASRGVRATTSKTTGKLYFEIGLNPGAGTAQSALGICTSTANMANLYGSNFVGGAGILIGNGWFYVNGSITSTQIESGTISPPCTICVAIDFPNSLMWVRATGGTNSGNWNGSGSNNPATGVGGVGISALFPSNPAFPVVSVFASIAGTRTANFGASAFVGTIPLGGFTAWG